MGQLLITALVALGVYIWWQQQGRSASKPAPSPQKRAAASLHKRPPLSLRLFATGLVLSALVASAGYALYDWRDKYTLLEVTLVHPVTSYRETYQVYKKDLKENAFTTREGQHIRIASNERLEVRRLQQQMK